MNFLLKLNTCSRTVNNKNVGIKHASYERVLQKRHVCALIKVTGKKTIYLRNL